MKSKSIKIISILTLIFGIILLTIILSNFSVNNKETPLSQKIQEGQNLQLKEQYDEFIIAECYQPLDQEKSRSCFVKLEQNNNNCYKVQKTVCGEKLVEISCLETPNQEKGPGKCFNLEQVKKICYKEMPTICGERLIETSCFEILEQEKGPGKCFNLPQIKSDCRKTSTKTC